MLIKNYLKVVMILKLLSRINFLFKTTHISSLGIYLFTAALLLIINITDFDLDISIYFQYALCIALPLTYLLFASQEFAMMKIPVFEFNLKLLDTSHLKRFIVLKCGYFTLVIMSISASISYGNIFIYLIVNCSTLIIFHLCTVSRKLTLRELSIDIVITAFLLFLTNQYISFTVFTLYLYIYGIKEINLVGMYNVALLSNDVLFKDYNSSYANQKINTKSISRTLLTHRNSIAIHKLYEIRYMLLLIIIIFAFKPISMLYPIILELTIIAIYIILTLIFDKLMSEDKVILSQKILQPKIVYYNFKINYFLYTVISLFTICIATIIYERLLLSMLILGASVYVIIQNRFIQSKVLKVVCDILFCIIISILLLSLH